MKLVFLVHFAATWYLVGLCWLVQRVQYPLMDRVGLEAFPAYEKGHVERIGLVVAPPMLIELGSGILLFLNGDPLFRETIFLVAMGLLVAIWLSTFLVQVPLHEKLARRFDVTDHRRLVRTNWIRTLAWTARGMLLATLFFLEFLRTNP